MNGTRHTAGGWMRAALVLGACALLGAAPAAMAADLDAAGKALAKVDADWSKAAAAREVNAVVSYYAADAVAYPPNAPVGVGQAAAKQVWAAMFADSTFSLSWTTLHADVSKSGDLGYTTGSYADSYMGKDGKPVQEVGKYVCVWAKQKDGKWKAIHDAWNADTK